MSSPAGRVWAGLPKTAVAVFCLFAVTLAEGSVSADAQELKIQTVPHTAVPGLLEHMKSVHGGVSYDYSKALVSPVDMNGDGRSDVIWAVVDFEYACGNAGCDYNVSLRRPDGTFSTVYSVLAFELAPQNTVSKGMRSVGVKTRAGQINMMWNGKAYIGADEYVLSGGEYESVGPDWTISTNGDAAASATLQPDAGTASSRDGDQVTGKYFAGDKEPRVPDQSQSSASPPAGQQANTTLRQYLGPCFKGHNWGGSSSGSGGSGQGGGVASYGGCGDGESWVQLFCSINSNEYELRIEDTVDGVRDGGTVALTFRVDGRRYRFRGTGQSNEMVGGVTPTVKFRSSDRFLEALQSGNRMIFNLGSRQSEVHLRGSRKAIETMLIHCGGS